MGCLTLHPAGLTSAALQALPAEQRVETALARLPGRAVLTSSFGAQAAVMLHMVTRIAPELPVVFIDTGYHFAETYRFVDQLTARLALNLQVYRSEISSAWQEARYGQRWSAGALDDYHQDNKIEPMQRAIAELDVGIWFAGLRRGQRGVRAARDVLEYQNGVWKVHPIIDWTDRDVGRYLLRHDLPYHPLWEQGYTSIGDHMLTTRLADAHTESAVRFNGLAEECGLHEAW